MPTNKIQLKKIKLTERANNEAETPERRLRAGKSLLLFSKFAKRPHRLAKKIANLFISDGLVSNEVREQAAKLLELTARNAVNDSAPDEDEVEMPAQFQIQRPKKQKPKFSLEAIRNGDDLGCWFWEVLMPGDPGFLEMSKDDFRMAKEKARQILLQSGKCANRTDRNDEVLQEFRRLVREILIDPASAARAIEQAESATPLASRTDYGVPVSLTRDQIVPRPDLQIPPPIGPGQSLPPIRVTCRICQSTDKGLVGIPHDCSQFQNL